MTNLSSLQQNKSYNWLVISNTNWQNIQDQYLPFIQDADYARRPQSYTRVSILQPSYDKTPQTYMVNVYSSTTGHKSNKYKKRHNKMELKNSSLNYKWKQNWKYFWKLKTELKRLLKIKIKNKNWITFLKIKTANRTENSLKIRIRKHNLNVY